MGGFWAHPFAFWRQKTSPNAHWNRGLKMKKPLRCKGFRWCCRTGLNCRPLPYQGSALPLSYGSMPGNTQARIGQSSDPAGGRFLPQGPLWRKQAGNPIVWPARSAGFPGSPRRPGDCAAGPHRQYVAMWQGYRGRTLGGLAMADEADGERRQGAGSSQGARQERLKLALRENLKRRKSQARERGKATEAPSNDHEACPHGELGKRGD